MIVREQHSFGWKRFYFKDGSVVDVAHYVFPPRGRAKNDKEKAEWKAAEDEAYRRCAVQSYAAHCKEATELHDILNKFNWEAERCRDLADTISAGATRLCDHWRSDEELKGINPFNREDGEKLSKTDQVHFLLTRLRRFARMLEKESALLGGLAVVSQVDAKHGSIDSGKSWGSNKVGEAAKYFPPGANLREMSFCTGMDDTHVYVVTEKQKAKRDQELAKRKAADDKKKLVAVKNAEAKRKARDAAKRKRRADKKPPIVPPAIAERLKNVQPSTNGHAKATANGTH